MARRAAEDSTSSELSKRSGKRGRDVPAPRGERTRRKSPIARTARARCQQASLAGAPALQLQRGHGRGVCGDALIQHPDSALRLAQRIHLSNAERAIFGSSGNFGKAARSLKSASYAPGERAVGCHPNRKASIDTAVLFSKKQQTTLTTVIALSFAARNRARLLVAR